MRSARWLGLLAGLLFVVPTAGAHGAGVLEVVPFDETIPAGAAVEASPTSFSPHGNMTVPEGADEVHVRMAWTPTAGTDPSIRLTLLDGPSTVLENRTVTWTAGKSPLEVAIPVEDVETLGWRVRAQDGLAADQYVRGEARFANVPSPDPSPAEPDRQPAAAAGQPTPEDPGPTATPEALAAAAAVSVALAALVRRLWGPIHGFLAGLYSRIGDEEVAEHPHRRRILELLDEDPGLHLGGLAGRMAVSESTLRHHLRKLVEADLVVRWETGGYVCYFRQGSAGPDERAALARLRSSTARTVLAALGSNQPDSQRALARSLDLAPSTVHYHVRQLGKAGLVDSETDNGLPEVTALGRRVLDRIAGG